MERSLLSWLLACFCGYVVSCVASTPALLQTLKYNQRGQLNDTLERYQTRSNYAYDTVGRVQSIGHNLGGTTEDVAFNFGYSPASQINSRTINNDLYTNTAHYDVERPYQVNGLNQYTGAVAASFAYDPNGNLTSDGAVGFIYDALK